MSCLSNEIHEQPGVLLRLLDRQAETTARIAAAISARDVRYAVIALGAPPTTQLVTPSTSSAR